MGRLVPYEPEGPECEWKERLPRPERVAKTLAAFANGCGGRLWVGVRDSGEAIGVADAGLVETALRVIMEELLDPLPAFTFRHHRWQGHKLVELVIEPCEDRPVGTRTATGDLRIYVRDGSSTRPASPHTVRSMERSAVRVDLLPGDGLDPKARRLLSLLAKQHEPSLTELARAARMGRRSARRLVIPLLRAGLVAENDRHRLWLTPLGHRATA